MPQRQEIGINPLGTEFVSGESVKLRYAAALRGLPIYTTRFASQLRGANRGIENDALEGYELYVNADTPVTDFSTPAVTGATLPLDYEVPSDGTYYFVLQARNKHNVVSGNREQSVIVIEDEAETDGPIAAVNNARAQVAGFKIRILAEYLEDTNASPTTFRIASRQLTSGAPATQTASATLSTRADGVAVLDTVLTMQDLTALPTQTGVVEIDVWARRGVSTDGPITTITANVPGATLASTTGIQAEEETGVAF